MSQDKPTYERIQAIADRSVEMLTPHWDARDNFAKTLISVASGVIALTVTFAKSIAVPQSNPIWRYSLFASWMFFLISILCCGIVLWLTKDIRLLAFKFFENRPDIKAALADIDLTKPESIKPMDDIRGKIFRPLESKELWSERFLTFAAIIFLIGLMLLSIIGWKQF
jgi:hypothetical protein